MTRFDYDQAAQASDADWIRWVEAVEEEIPFEFYTPHIEWVDDPDGQYNNWLNRLHAENKPPKHAAQIVMRAFKFYKLNE